MSCSMDTTAYLKLGPNRTLYYEYLDQAPDRPVLVFLHEGLGCIQMWKGFCRSLCRLTRCSGLMYDRLGYGRSSSLVSPRTTGYLHEYALEELPVLLDTLIPGRPYILIGHSDGGSISLIHAAQNPAHLTGIITEAAHVFVEEITLEGIKNATVAYKKGKLKGLAAYHGEKTDLLFRAWSDTWLSDAFKSWNIESLLADIKTPLLVIQGEDDQYGTQDQVTAITSQTAGPARPCMIPDCGHAPHADQPEAVALAMNEFIRGLEPAPGL